MVKLRELCEGRERSKRVSKSGSSDRVVSTRHDNNIVTRL